MELVAPLAYLYGLALPISTSGSAIGGLYHSLSAPLRQPSSLLAALRALPRARLILALAFLVHYGNRSVISTLRNPERARMNLSVPLSAILFNLANGITMGMFVGGGYGSADGATQSALFGEQKANGGFSQHVWARPLFTVGMLVWAAGFLSNIYHDEVLYSLKRRRAQKPNPSPSAPPSERYSIPPRSKGLYRYLSHPAYSSEWLEWTGYFLATLALGPAPFPSYASTLVLGGGGKRLVPLPSTLRPSTTWFLQPPILFVLMEVAIMLPRATRGHAWYEKTFGRKEWTEKGQRWVVVPGVW